MAPTTGALVPSIVPAANSSITALTPDGSGGYFIAGRFTNIGTARVAHVLADGSVDPAFQFPHVIEGVITSLVRVGPSLVAGGYSLHVDSVFRPLFAMNLATGALSPWAPVLPNQDIAVSAVVVANGLLIVLSRNGNATLRFVTAYDGASGAVVWQTDVTGAPGHFAPGAMGLSGGRLIVGMGRLYSLDPLTGVVDPAWAAGMPVAEGLLTMAISPTAIYVGGTFQVYWGQPRGRLAAVDPATGTLLPWSPQSSESIGALAVSATGSVFVASNRNAGPLAINGQLLGTVAEVDATGAPTAFRSAAPVESVELLQMSSTNTLFVSGFSGYVGQVSRSALATFDLTTSTLLPQAITPGGAGATVEQLVPSGTVLYLRGGFTTVNGQPRDFVAAVDVSSNTVLSWPAAGVDVGTLGPADATHVYARIRESGQIALRRLGAATGGVDPTWRPAVDGAVALEGGDILLSTGLPFQGASQGAVIGTLDAVDGHLRELVRSLAFTPASAPWADGDTLYVLGQIRSVVPPVGAFLGHGLFAFDRRTSTPVWRPPVAGFVSNVTLSGGRLLVAGRDMTVAGAPHFGLFEMTRGGAVTSWDSGFRPFSGPTAPGGATVLTVDANLLVATGTVTRDLFRLAVYDLAGSHAPVNLRSQVVGQNTVFSWDPMASPPPGGYVIEGGFAAGQTAAALVVGNATSVALPMPAGPLCIRVRPQGSMEVSNEIVAGCVAPPLPPTALTTTLVGTMLTLAWAPPAATVTNYTLLAGTAAGLSNVVTLPLGPQTSVSGSVPGGTFFARVTATNACGTSGPSGEVFFTIGAPDPLPAAPTNLAASVSGNTATLSWTAPAGPVTGYVLEAGTSVGLANPGTLSIGGTPSLVIPGVPAGTYVLRVRAVTSAGSGAPSTDVVVVVP